jgi:hypothetical protein
LSAPFARTKLVQVSPSRTAHDGQHHELAYANDAARRILIVTLDDKSGTVMTVYGR